MLKIYIDYDFASLNKIIDISRSNVYAANNLKKKEMDIVRYYTIGKKPINKYPLKIVFTWHFESKRRDLDNCVPKNILDSLVSLRILKNDNLNCIREILHKSVIDGRTGVDIEISEYSESDGKKNGYKKDE